MRRPELDKIGGLGSHPLGKVPSREPMLPLGIAEMSDDGHVGSAAAAEQPQVTTTPTVNGRALDAARGLDAAAGVSEVAQSADLPPSMISSVTRRLMNRATRTILKAPRKASPARVEGSAGRWQSRRLRGLWRPRPARGSMGDQAGHQIVGLAARRDRCLEPQ